MTVLVGLMSGTSLDGISAAAVRFEEAGAELHAELIAFVQRPYTAAQRSRLEGAMQGGTAAEYCRLQAELGEWFAEAAQAVMAAATLAPSDVAAVASHGQTLWHEPGQSSWQAGDASRIAERTGCRVIADFRTRDIAAGGQGAPLVPIADRLLFAHATEPRALQNLGGIGNVTVVPPATDRKTPVLAFDTGPGVVIINGVTQALFGQPFDVDGALARAGRVVPGIVEEVLLLPFFSEEPPKSTGRELFTPAFIEQLIASCRAAGASPTDCLATATAITAQSIADQYRRFVPPVAEVLLSGGGARNLALADAIAAALATLPASGWPAAPRVRRFDDVHFDPDAKEAVAFALLGYLHLEGRPGNVPSATGASGPRVLGSLTPATPLHV